ncbi:MAG: DUF2019 domain-containing protein [Phycisphaerales bacterium]
MADYKEAARLHGEFTESGDHKATNKAHDKIATIYAELRHRGEDAQRKLLPLLRDRDPSVRCWAAAHALDFAPHEGAPVLQSLAQNQCGFLGFGAKMTLREWEAGRLRFP